MSNTKPPTGFVVGDRQPPEDLELILDGIRFMQEELGIVSDELPRTYGLGPAAFAVVAGLLVCLALWSEATAGLLFLIGAAVFVVGGAIYVLGRWSGLLTLPYRGLAGEDDD